VDYKVRLVTTTPHYGGSGGGLFVRSCAVTADRRAAWRSSTSRQVESISGAARATGSPIGHARRAGKTANSGPCSPQIWERTQGWSEKLFVGGVTDTPVFPNCRPFASPFPAPAGLRHHDAGRQGDVFADFERAMIQERVRAGLRRAKDEGKQLGRSPDRKTSKGESLAL
jgi:hypothetical protein